MDQFEKTSTDKALQFNPQVHAQIRRIPSAHEQGSVKLHQNSSARGVRHAIHNELTNWIELEQSVKISRQLYAYYSSTGWRACPPSLLANKLCR